MNKNREKIEKIIDTLEDLGKKYDFRNLETAIVIWLRGNLENISDEELTELDKKIFDYDGSLLNDNIKELIDEL